MSEPILVIEQMNDKGYHLVRFHGDDYYITDAWDAEVDYHYNQIEVRVKFARLPEHLKPNLPVRETYTSRFGLRKPR